MARLHQEHVEEIILSVLCDTKTVMTTQELYRAVRMRSDPAPEDLEQANRRENETKLDQITANALQEARRLCRNGFIERVGRGEFRITVTGQKYVADQRDTIEFMRSQLPPGLGD